MDTQELKQNAGVKQGNGAATASLAIAAQGVTTSREFANLMSALMVDLINSGNARQGQNLNFLSQMLSGLGSFV